MKRNAIETVMGAVVLVIAGGFLAFAYQTSDIHGGRSEGYHVSADFTNATGIGKGGDVRIGGVKVGVVQALDLDPKTYQAHVTLAVDPSVKIPTDSSAAIVSDGLLGSKFVALTPGADDTMLAEGGRLDYTQSSVSLEELIGKFAFSGGGVDKGGDAKSDAPAASASSSAPSDAKPDPGAKPDISLP